MGDSDGSFLNDSFILNKSFICLGKNELSQEMIHSVAHAQHPIGGSALNSFTFFESWGFPSRSFIT